MAGEIVQIKERLARLEERTREMVAAGDLDHRIAMEIDGLKTQLHQLDDKETAEKKIALANIKRELELLECATGQSEKSPSL
jgi:hypothetical protein